MKTKIAGWIDERSGDSLSNLSRREFHDRNGNRCYYCGHHTFLGRAGKKPEKRTATVEHLLPKSRYAEFNVPMINGRATPEFKQRNKATACYECNTNKGSMTVEEYRAQLETETGSPILFYGERAALM